MLFDNEHYLKSDGHVCWVEWEGMLIGLEKTYDTVSREKLWRIVEECSICEKLMMC